MDKHFNPLIPNSLVWLEEHGVGFFEVQNDGVYDAAYFDKYVGMKDTEIGKALTEFRVSLVDKYVNPETCVDIGIGSGAFVEAANCSGYDINPVAVKYLGAKFVNPYDRIVKSITCWDSLEHIRDFGALLNQVEGYVFVSIPIFKDAHHVTLSRHYRKNEHYWYFTDAGFKAAMLKYGFHVVEQNHRETEIGRDSIGTYVLRRNQ